MEKVADLDGRIIYVQILKEEISQEKKKIVLFNYMKCLAIGEFIIFKNYYLLILVKLGFSNILFF